MNKMYADGHNWNQNMCFNVLFLLQLTFLLGGEMGPPAATAPYLFPQLDTVHMEVLPEPVSAYSLPSSAVNLTSKILYDSQF